MKTLQHAPGPWSQHGRQVKMISHGRYHTIATVNNPKFSKECNSANAALIAAAPELLRATEYLLQLVDRNVSPDAPQAIARALSAVAKAKGGAQ